MAIKLNDYFCSVFNSPSNAHQDVGQCEVDQPNSTNNENTLESLEITANDVLIAIDNLKINKSPGPDNIFPKNLKETKNEIVHSLTSIFNKSIQQGNDCYANL